jgi:hypothetical protein
MINCVKPINQKLGFVRYNRVFAVIVITEFDKKNFKIKFMNFNPTLLIYFGSSMDFERFIFNIKIKFP